MGKIRWADQTPRPEQGSSCCPAANGSDKTVSGRSISRPGWFSTADMTNSLNVTSTGVRGDVLPVNEIPAPLQPIALIQYGDLDQVSRPQPPLNAVLRHQRRTEGVIDGIFGGLAVPHAANIFFRYVRVKSAEPVVFRIAHDELLALELTEIDPLAVCPVMLFSDNQNQRILHEELHVQIAFFGGDRE